MYAYIASYPLGSGITPQVDVATAGRLRCDAPHRKISIVSIPLADPEAASVRTKALSSETEPYDNDGPIGPQAAFQACHDHQAFLPRDIMVASCAGDLQYWDISDAATRRPATAAAHVDPARGAARQSDDPAERALGVVRFRPQRDGLVGRPRGHDDRRERRRRRAALRRQNTKRGFTWFYPLVAPAATSTGSTTCSAATSFRARRTARCAFRITATCCRCDAGTCRRRRSTRRQRAVRLHRPVEAEEIAWADVESGIRGPPTRGRPTGTTTSSTSTAASTVVAPAEPRVRDLRRTRRVRRAVAARRLEVAEPADARNLAGAAQAALPLRNGSAAPGPRSRARQRSPEIPLPKSLAQVHSQSPDPRPRGAACRAGHPDARSGRPPVVRDAALASPNRAHCDNGVAGAERLLVVLLVALASSIAAADTVRRTSTWWSSPRATL